MCLARLIFFALVVGISSKFLGTGGTLAVALIMGVDLVYNLYKTYNDKEKLSNHLGEQEQKDDEL